VIERSPKGRKRNAAMRKSIEMMIAGRERQAG
jgi:hypothetical protein